MKKFKGAYMLGRQIPGGRVLEAYLLCFLSGGEADHGYGLKVKLAEHGFDDANINIGTLYRALRKLEGQDLVKSSWAESEQGPRKRVYSITDNGREELKEIISFLKGRRDVIEMVLNHYKEHILKEEVDKDE